MVGMEPVTGIPTGSGYLFHAYGDPGHSSIGGSLYPFVAPGLSNSGILAVIGSKNTGGAQSPDTISP